MVIWTVFVALKAQRISGEELILEKVNVFKELHRRNIEPRKIRSLLNYIRFYVRLNDEELNQKFEKEVLRITGNKNTMGVEEILLQQAKNQGVKMGWEQGLEKGLEKGLVRELERIEESTKKLILAGMNNDFICDVLDLDEAFVKKIRKKLAG